MQIHHILDLGGSGDRTNSNTNNYIQLYSNIIDQDNLYNMIDGNINNVSIVNKDNLTGYIYFKFSLNSKISQIKIFTSLIDDEIGAIFSFEYSDDGKFWTHDNENIITLTNIDKYDVIKSNDFHIWYRLSLAGGLTKQFSISDIRFKIGTIFDEVQYAYQMNKNYRDNFGYPKQYTSIYDKLGSN